MDYRMTEPLPRVMWLLSHSTAREFEIAMLKKLGFAEVFLPKSFPMEAGFRSASVDYSEDARLSIPPDDLAILNAADWYSDPGRDVWQIANKHFQVLFFIVQSSSFLSSMARHFQGVAILRAYGLSQDMSYDRILLHYGQGTRMLDGLGRRLWMGTAYEHIASIEPPWLRRREVYLPAGLGDCRVREDWTGHDPTLLFVCPEVATNPYYMQIYRKFKTWFADFPYVVGGAQPLMPNDPHVLGFVPADAYRRNMREFRVMFYHSTEPNHVHYHPFEAVRAGMPLIFMGGGILDRFGGDGLPGRCSSYEEARHKVRRILDNDRKLINEIRFSQPRLLNGLHPETLQPLWRQGMEQVVDSLRSLPPSTLSRKPRIAVILPVPYRGGTLRSAKLLAQALLAGSRQFDEKADVVFAYPHVPEEGADKWDEGLSPEIPRRSLTWLALEAAAARRAMKFAGHSAWGPTAERYLAMDDGMQQFCDCDLWIIVSDRLSAPLLPIRPYILLIFDYLQRYDAAFPENADYAFLAAARAAARVLVTTRFTEGDALAYGGIARERLFRVPMLIPERPTVECAHREAGDSHFLWTTNLAAHKNHLNAVRALREYYEVLDGRLECRVTGADTKELLKSELPHIQPLRALVSESKVLAKKLRPLGELPEMLYQRQLATASFLWHPAQVDNGTLSVVEAAQLGVPSLSSRYPAMEEMNERFGLHLAWMEAGDPSQMARQLKWMEEHGPSVRSRLPGTNALAAHSVEEVASEYWKVVRECL
jgi:glycosyltransferase involved in cell wall biosynthesis